MTVNPLTVSLVTLGIALIMYLFDSLYAGRWLRIRKESLAYVAASVLIGVFGEVFIETIYAWAFGQPLWHYQFLPVHHGYTSLYSVVLWTMYGMHLYWVQVALRSKYDSLVRWKLASVFAIESLLLETFANVVWLWVFGYLIYFYTPTDLWHATTIQNIPCYFAASWAIIVTVKRFRREPWFYTGIAALIVMVFLWFP